MRIKPYFLSHQLKIFLAIACFVSGSRSVVAQMIVAGTVYDSSKVNPVSGVLVKNTSGAVTLTDSVGHYEIYTNDNDSLTFIYNNKPTAKFAVKQIPNIAGFDISIHVKVASRFQTMREVKVYSKNYRQDSIENRIYYNKIFGYDKPGIASSINPGSGSVGLDLDEFINIFRFRRNRQLKKMQDRLLEQEQENYIKYRFNKITVKRITKLDGAELDNFMELYKPSFDFTQMAGTVEFYQYILNASYQYKKDLLIRKNNTP